MPICLRMVVPVACLVAAGCQTSPDPAAVIQTSQTRLDSTLAGLEMAGNLEEALDRYQSVVTDLLQLGLSPSDSAYKEQQRVLAYAYLRTGNMLRQLGRMDDAILIGEKELDCARKAGDSISLARSLMSYGATLIVTDRAERGLSLIEEARQLFEQGTSFDHRQGLGWYWLLRAELVLAGKIDAEPDTVLAYADTALSILRPIENWPGVARAHALRAKVNETLGDTASAAIDSELQQQYEARTP
jgi:tetratricopeptide (TPR) repeat protein